jgi:hypothetical protein
MLHPRVTFDVILVTYPCSCGSYLDVHYVLRILDDLGDTRNEWFEAIDLDTG